MIKKEQGPTVLKNILTVTRGLSSGLYLIKVLLLRCATLGSRL